MLFFFDILKYILQWHFKAHFTVVAEFTKTYFCKVIF
jgi:hypothetical protein